MNRHISRLFQWVFKGPFQFSFLEYNISFSWFAGSAKLCVMSEIHGWLSSKPRTLSLAILVGWQLASPFNECCGLSVPVQVAGKDTGGEVINMTILKQIPQLIWRIFNSFINSPYPHIDQYNLSLLKPSNQDTWFGAGPMIKYKQLLFNLIKRIYCVLQILQLWHKTGISLSQNGMQSAHT